MKDYYKILGVKKDASEEEIRKQWVEWMRKLHPDQHTEREVEDQRIREVNEAYQVLKHSSTRMEYDLKWAYGQKKRRSNPIRWSLAMVMIAVILVMVAVYVKKPKGTVQSALMVPPEKIVISHQKAEGSKQNSEARIRNSESSPLSNETNPIDQRNQKEQKPIVRSQNSESRKQDAERRTQNAEVGSPSNQTNDINQTDQTDQTDQRNQIDQTDQTDQTDVELPQAPKITMVFASEGDQVPQTAQSTPEPIAPPIQRRIVPPTPEPVIPSFHPPTSPSSRPPLPPFTTSLVATEEEVKQFFNEYVERYNQKDLEGFFSLFSRKATQNRQNKLEDIRKVYTDFFNQSQRIRYTLYDTRTEIYQNGIEMRARYELVQTLKQGGDKVWKGSIKWTLVKEDGTLKILSLEYQPQKSL